MPWWAPLGGLAGLMFVNTIGAFAGLIILVNPLISVVIGRFGWFGTRMHTLSPSCMTGCALMVIAILFTPRI